MSQHDETVGGDHIDLSVETLVADLMELIAIPSVVDPTTGTTVDDVNRAGELAMDQLRSAGLTEVRSIEMEPGVPRLVYGEYRVPDAPEGTPTVLCYGHFDVVPAQGWAEAFRPAVRDTPDGKRIFGRGAADDKSAIVMHCGAIKAFNGHPPVHLKIVLEGEEEISGAALERYLAAHPELFQAEVLVVADNGNSELGCPTLTSSLRGTLRVDLTVETMASSVHSGAYGGPVPDAFFALTRLLAALHDERGAVAVPGLTREHWDGVEPREEMLRRDAKLLDGVRLQGTDSLGSRLFGQPAITVLGLDGIPPLSQAANILAPKVTARLGMRVPPAQDPGEAIKCLTEYLEEVNERQCRAKITITVPVEPSAGWKADLTHPGYRAAERALAAAYPGKTVRYGGMGASIPLVNRLQAINPKSAILVWGTEEPGAMIHSDSESVSVDELVRMTLTERNLLADLGGGSGASGT